MNRQKNSTIETELRGTIAQEDSLKCQRVKGDFFGLGRGPQLGALEEALVGTTRVQTIDSPKWVKSS